ncbi:TPA: hypothetical protein CPT95_06205, partial [Candidatus Gastranaerophilales bacterium HUM_15]
DVSKPDASPLNDIVTLITYIFQPSWGLLKKEVLDLPNTYSIHFNKVTFAMIMEIFRQIFIPCTCLQYKCKYVINTL